MTDVMKFEDYIATISYDDSAELFHGQVVGMSDIITFQGKSTTELKKAFKDSVHDYLAMCKEDGSEPEKSYSGNFPVRTTADIHEFLYKSSKILGVSMGETVSLMTDYFISHENLNSPELLAHVLDEFRNANRRKVRYG